MTTIHRPQSPAEAQQLVRDALARRESLEIVGRGTCRSYGRPMQVAARLDLSALRGIVAYEPGELVLSAQASTTLSEIDSVLGEHRQRLAFEPPRLGSLYGNDGDGTLAGCLALGLGGPRRPSVGAPRDHLLGVKAINGFGESFVAGGRVVKNVTGFDIPKLMAGSLGTLAVLTELTVRLSPVPPMSCTLLLHGLEERAALAAMRAALDSPAQVTGAAHVPPALSGGSEAIAACAAGTALTALRLEGFAPSTRARLRRLQQLLRPTGASMSCIEEPSAPFWAQIRDAAPFGGRPDAQIWRIALPASYAGSLLGALQRLPGRYFLDWGGSLVWVQTDEEQSRSLRALVAQATQATAGATLVRAEPPTRAQLGALPPLAEPLAALSARVKRQFDPEGLFNRGRMYLEF